jgi:hypothetical protein
LTRSCRINRVIRPTRRVSRVFDFPYFFHKSGLVPTLGQLGPRLTHRAGPGFKNMTVTVKSLSIPHSNKQFSIT